MVKYLNNNNVINLNVVDIIIIYVEICEEFSNIARKSTCSCIIN